MNRKKEGRELLRVWWQKLKLFTFFPPNRFYASQGKKGKCRSGPLRQLKSSFYFFGGFSGPPIEAQENPEK